LIDIRSLHAPLGHLIASSPVQASLGPLKSYATLTELTRNPPETRSAIEKNWFTFHPATGETFLHYDISEPNPTRPARGRTFAKLLGAGLSTTNLTDPREKPCIPDLPNAEDDGSLGTPRWHQATNSLRLVLCNRADKNCRPNRNNTVFFAIIHRKISNHLGLPLRYERYVQVWAGTAPYGMIGISQHPILLANETTALWPKWQNWEDDPENAKIVAANKLKYGPGSNLTELTGTKGPDAYGGKGYWAWFTYTVSIAWAYGRQGTEMDGMNEGYLDDEVFLSIGIDDSGQGFGRVKAGDLVACMRACPGRSS
jgi:hypothetical protein